MKKFNTLSASFILFAVISCSVYAQSLTVSGTLFLPQDSIGFTYSSPSFSETDWIGIYHEGEIPGTVTPSITRKYAPSDSGTTEFAAVLAKGDYLVYPVCCDGYEVKAVYSFTVVDETSPSLVATKPAYALGEAVELIYNSPEYVSTDWIGICYPGDIPANVRSIVWDYLPGSSGTMTFVSPYPFGTLVEENPDGTLPPGEYWVGLFCCDAYGVYASTTFLVTEHWVSIEPYPETEANLKVYPNPASSLVNIRTTNGEKLEQIVVYNLTGQVLYQDRNAGSVNEKVVDLKLSRGIYLLEVQTQTSRMKERLIIR